MGKLLFKFVLVLAFFTSSVKAQSLTPEEYIELYKDIAIIEMKRMGVPAAITLAQGLLESESGNSVLVKKSNNHFGIKCKSNWTAEGVSHDDDAPGECFRVYKDAEESYRDHSNFLRGGGRYSFLFSLDPTDYKGWANGLKRAGYATNPKYPALLIRHIELYDLQQYSIEGASQNSAAIPGSGKNEDNLVKNTAYQSMDNRTEMVTENTRETQLPSKEDNIQFINGIKCITARKGASILAIASRFKINLQKLLDINELEEDGILEEDQLIFLQRKSKTGSRDYVIVQKEQTLYDVAQSNGILLESLLEYNQLEEDGEVVPGTRLYLKMVADKNNLAEFQNTAIVSSSSILYEVQPKEGLFAVARKHSVTVQQLKEWNNLTSDELKIGQQLIVKK